ncbi:hypothetical protein NIES970_22900 [[Synechococcus] sp. NIES-970]|nr:hypothetical protein NIES970_22900 [[Synechococcus] sp. NIES-970]
MSSHCFQLSILALNDHQYQLQLELAIALDAEPTLAVVTWQPEQWLATWGDYPLETWGDILFEALFVGDIRDQWEDTLAIAQTDHLPIQVTLALPPGILWFLPWEAMFMGAEYEHVQFLRRQLPAHDQAAPTKTNQQNLDMDLPWLTRVDPDPEEDLTFIQDIFANVPDKTFFVTPESSSLPVSKPAVAPERKVLTRRTSILGFGLILAIATGGILLGQHLQRSVPEELDPSASPGIVRLTNTALKNTESTELAALLETEMAQANWGNVQTVVEILLDRGAFTAVEPFLFGGAITPDNANATIAFLRGRYLWQTTLGSTGTGVAMATSEMAIAPAQAQWERGLTYQPNNPESLMALGFAHYVRGEYEIANEYWYRALSAPPSLALPPPAQAQIYAGLALGMYQIAQTQGDPEQEIFFGKAQKLRAIALDLDPTHLQPQVLKGQWLWNAETIATWQNLLTLAPEG